MEHDPKHHASEIRALYLSSNPPSVAASLSPIGILTTVATYFRDHPEVQSAAGLILTELVQQLTGA